jgi:hypothetical protein
MKLNSTKIAQAREQQHANPIADTHPATSAFRRRFGDHTFFVDKDGLHVIEPTGPNQANANASVFVRLASWKNARRTTLRPHAPRLTNRVVRFARTDAPATRAK